MKYYQEKKIGNSIVLADHFLDEARAKVVAEVESGTDSFERLSYETPCKISRKDKIELRKR